MNTPGRAGLYLFSGIRRTSRPGNIVTVRDVVEVRPVKWRKEEELAVFFFGRQQAFRLEMFEGEFRPLRIDFGGERTS